MTEALIIYTVNNYGIISSYDGSENFNLTNVSLTQYIPSNNLQYIQVFGKIDKDFEDLVRLIFYATISKLKALK